MKDTQNIVEEDELGICSKTVNLSNNHIESEKKKNQKPKY